MADPTPKSFYASLPPTLILMSTKAYFSPSKTLSFTSTLLSPDTDILPLPSNLLFGLIPDYLTIQPISQLLSTNTLTKSWPNTFHHKGWPIHLGAQDVHFARNYGAHTGSIVAPALAELGVTIVELNHAERRRDLGENDETTAHKAAAVCAAGMIPLVCVGELSAPSDRAENMQENVAKAMQELSIQINSVLRAVPADAPIILAYEPVWAIGADKPAGVDFVGPVVQAIRACVKQTGRSGVTRVVYGGSAGPGLWSGKATGGEGLGKYVDGMFLGRFAHKIEGVQGVLDEVLESLKVTE